MATRDRMTACLHVWSVAFALSMGALCAPTSAQSRYGIGHAATPAQVAAWNLDVSPDGRNLPAGQGSVLRGREVFANQCAACHGARGEGGGLGDKLAGGQGTLATPTPVRTVGSYWPYATTLFDYVRRAMPLNAPQSLSNEDVYAVSGYVLHLNGLLAEDAVVSAKTLTELKMPNGDGFVSDPRPDVRNTGCLRDCIK
jgi:cytochrome c